MPRRFRIRLLRDAWTYGNEPARHIPAGTELVLTEAEAAAFLKDRRNRRHAEVIGMLDDSDDDADVP